MRLEIAWTMTIQTHWAVGKCYVWEQKLYNFPLLRRTYKQDENLCICPTSEALMTGLFHIQEYWLQTAPQPLLTQWALAMPIVRGYNTYDILS